MRFIKKFAEMNIELTSVRKRQSRMLSSSVCLA